MVYNTLGRTGLKISAVTFGGIIGMDETPQDARQYVEHAIERGVNYFDVAPSYGNAEERLGPAIEPHRSHIFLACKTYQRDAENAKIELLNSLRVLRTEYFDVYQLHSLTTEEDLKQVFARGGAMETVLWAKREGLIRNIGMSVHSEEVALKAMENFAFDTVLFPMYWAMGINAGWGDRISARAKEREMGLLAMKTLIHRAWMDGDDKSRFPKSWCKPIWDDEILGVAAMKYGLFKGAATLIPPGNFEHFLFMLDHIERCVNEPLTGEEWSLLRGEAARVKDHPIF